MKYLICLVFLIPGFVVGEEAKIIIDEIEKVDIKYHEKKWYLVGEALAGFDTNKAENLLFKYVDKNQDIVLLSSKEYLYQYKFIDKNTIEIHGVCFDLPNTYDLNKGFVTVMDGGNCFFSVKYDLANKLFLDLWINGYA